MNQDSESYHGLLLINKEPGPTSHDLVREIRKIFSIKSVGHCGTLDPMADGLMVLLLGEATKLSNYILERDKSYRVTVQLGISTDTLDTTGKILHSQKTDLPAEVVKQVAISLQGDIVLPVPEYSAVKVDGVPLHEAARRGEPVETPSRQMRFYDFKNFEQGIDWIAFDLSCSKGSYVRSWANEFGRKLGCGAAMSALTRTASYPYLLSQAISMEEVSKKMREGVILQSLIPMTYALPEYKVIRVSGLDETLFSHGQISHGLRAQLISVFKPNLDEGVKVISRPTGRLMGLVGLEPGKGFVIRRVFKY